MIRVGIFSPGLVRGCSNAELFSEPLAETYIIIPPSYQTFAFFDRTYIDLVCVGGVNTFFAMCKLQRIFL